MEAAPRLRLRALWLAFGWALALITRGSLFLQIERALSANLRG